MSTKQHPPLILELIDRKPSLFVMKGTEMAEEPDRLDVSSQYMLLNDSVVLVAGEKKTDPKKHKKARWISGCDLILVEEQDKMGIKPNPLNDVIVFKFGRLVVEREGKDIGLYDFLKKYDGNISNPDRPESAIGIFKEINTAVEAEERITDIDAEGDALKYLSSLQTKKGGQGGTAKTYEYNTEKIAWCCKLFNLTTGDSPSEQLEALVTKARQNPSLFNDMIADASSDLKVVIKTARELGVISLDGDVASFAEDKSVICKLKSKAMNDKIDELAEYLRSADGETANSAIRVQVEHAKSNSVK